MLWRRSSVVPQAVPEAVAPDVTPRVPAARMLPPGMPLASLTTKELEVLVEAAAYRQVRADRDRVDTLRDEVGELRKWVTMLCVILVLFLITLLVILIKYRK